MSTDLQQTRAGLNAAVRNIWQQYTHEIVSHEASVPSENHVIPVRVWQPKYPTTHPRDVSLAIHGGGWSMGDEYADSFMVRALVQKLNMTVVTLDYRLSPDTTYPGPFQDVLTVFKWVLNRPGAIYPDGESQGARPDHDIFVCGFSAGANLAAALCLWARENKLLSKIRAQILFSPAVCHYKCYSIAQERHDCELKSFYTAGSPLLDREVLASFWDNYVPDLAMVADSTYVSPLLETDLSNLPSSYIQVAGADPLRDEGIAYAEALRRAGVKVKLEVYPGLPHAFQSEIVGMKSGQKAMEDFVEHILQSKACS
ncbi:hypothetical protein HBH70_026440 [Parastagonospora nodorum]|nr:hypothetical protein HBH46_194560 [Parastagonospora nodorum]KAH4111632.1 hypothetical protein HBH47_239610 [Parastagonospora nodorum]KAH5148434.1 hypothetical protein HBH70_026440 [Parastagonospora nodorum]KAH5210303.1 hypothetical protein HBH68_075660 [Parastagonospora nodorum]KAH5400302.1 hypothetical protein HBI47_199040 [Parastagonospora nodorum]